MIVERTAATAAAVALAAALAAPGCRPAERAARPAAADGRVVLDLVAEMAAATVEQESARLDLGEPSARAHLVAGWSVDERDADGSYVWGMGRAATLSFFAAAPARIDLGLHCKPLAFDGAPRQTMAVAVNGHRLAELPMELRLSRYRVEVPAERVEVGWNRLDLGFDYHRRPRDVAGDTADDRSLAARCYRVEFEGLGARAPARAAGAPAAETPSPEELDRLRLPSGTAVTYYFDSPEDSELVIEAVRAWGDRAGGVRLIVRATTADDQTTRVVGANGGSGLRLPLASARSMVHRLQLAVVDPKRGRPLGWLARTFGGKPKASGLTLVRPSIRAARSETGAGAHEPLAAAHAAERPSVIIYLIDTLRADHLGAYGYARPTSPNIDRFAADGVLFENALAQTSWTRPAVATLLTGLAPRSHGVSGRQDALSASVDTLAELLAAEGYRTAGFVTNGNAGPDFGLGQGYEVYRHLRESSTTPHRHKLSDQLNHRLFAWLDNMVTSRRESGDPTRPFFLYAHATDPHAPYTPNEPFRGRFASDADPDVGRLANVRAVFRGEIEPTETIRHDLTNLYDAEIAFNDHHFGRLIERLKKLELYDDSLIILVSDHGEEFLDHGGWEHGATLFEEQLHVPLIAKLPGGASAGRRVAATARQVDVMPTILDLLGIAPPAPLDGASLLRPIERTSFAHLRLQDRQMRSVNHRGWKMILDDSEHTRGGSLQLYHLEDDPLETIELTEQRPFERELLSQLMRRFEIHLTQGVRATGVEAEIPEELRRQLEALGYLNASEPRPESRE